MDVLPGPKDIQGHGFIRQPEFLIHWRELKHLFGSSEIIGKIRCWMRGHLLEERGELESSDESASGDLVRLETGDALAVEDDRAAGRSEKAAQQIEAGRLAGAVGADQTDDLTLVDGEIDVADGRQPAELRPLTFQRGYTRQAAGSVLVNMGRTMVLCTCSVELTVPPFLEGTGKAWAELNTSYAPHPRVYYGKSRESRNLHAAANFTYTGSGGIALGGASTAAAALSYTGSGGIALGGSGRVNSDIRCKRFIPPPRRYATLGRTIPGTTRSWR